MVSWLQCMGMGMAAMIHNIQPDISCILRSVDVKCFGVVIKHINRCQFIRVVTSVRNFWMEISSNEASGVSAGRISEDNVNWNYGRISYWQSSFGNQLDVFLIISKFLPLDNSVIIFYRLFHKFIINILIKK